MKESKDKSSQKYEYSLFVHWKQGDDLAHYLAHNKGDAKRSLIEWAQSFRRSSEIIRKLAAMFEQKTLQIYADTHHISLIGDIETLEAAVKERLINKHKIDY